MHIKTSADMNPELAAALGRFAQACTYLEDSLLFTLTRMLPITTQMGYVLFARRMMRNNVKALEGLLKLKEVAITDEERTRLSGLINRLKAVTQDRNRFLHNKIGGGWESPLYLTVPNDNGTGSVAMEVTIALINERTEEAQKLWGELYIAVPNYDMSDWIMQFGEHRLQDYPIAKK